MGHISYLKTQFQSKNTHEQSYDYLKPFQRSFVTNVVKMSPVALENKIFWLCHNLSLEKGVTFHLTFLHKGALC